MRLKFFHLSFQWPEHLPLQDLRKYLIEEISKYGKPLRWAITSVEGGAEPFSNRKVNIEAVIKISY